jgi:hypothetical protein
VSTYATLRESQNRVLRVLRPKIGKEREVREIAYARFEVFMAVKIQDEVFWVVTPCSAMVGYQRFRGPCCVHRPDKVISSRLFSSLLHPEDGHSMEL